MTDDDANSRPPRRRLQFGLRTALWLVAVAALGFGWWRERAEQDRRIDRLEMLLEAHMLLQPPPDSAQPATPFASPLDEFDANAYVEPLLDRFQVTLLPADQVDETLRRFTAMLDNADAAARARAACTLALFAGNAAPAVPRLQQLLEDPDRSVRWHALLALGEIGPDAAPAADAVRQLMDDDESGMPAFAAQMLLRITPDAKISQRFAALLGHSNAKTRRRGLEALTQLEDDTAHAAVPAMVGLLEDDDGKTRMAAIEAVVQLAPRRVAQSAITRMFHREENGAVRRLAATHLIQLESQRGADE